MNTTDLAHKIAAATLGLTNAEAWRQIELQLLAAGVPARATGPVRDEVWAERRRLKKPPQTRVQAPGKNASAPAPAPTPE
jgi:hypothetical protein